LKAAVIRAITNMPSAAAIERPSITRKVATVRAVGRLRIAPQQVEGESIDRWEADALATKAFHRL
jgi:hypothetical protein